MHFFCNLGTFFISSTGIDQLIMSIIYTVYLNLYRQRDVLHDLYT